jgi:hypothetical protein
MAQVVDHLPSKRKAVSSKPSTTERIKFLLLGAGGSYL